MTTISSMSTWSDCIVSISPGKFFLLGVTKIDNYTEVFKPPGLSALPGSLSEFLSLLSYFLKGDEGL